MLNNPLMKKILVVEDDKSIRELLIEILQDEGYSVTFGENGEEGLKSLESVVPDLILMDVSMPIMDGYTFKSELLKNDQWNTIPVIVMSAQDQGPEKLESHGFSNFIQKPLELNHLLETIIELA